MRILPVPCLSDNYAYLVVDEGSGEAAVVDPSEAAPVRERIRAEGVELRALWLTHHHWDHVGGIEELCDSYDELEVLGSAYDREHGRIPRQTKGLSQDDTLSFGSHEVRIVENPGHTLGGITFVVDGHAFTGDTLFLAGCGRVFEGTMEMMTRSMEALRSLPPDTRIWCGHEYTVKNLEFARSVDPDNSAVTRRLADAKRQREAGEPTVPGALREELETNPFLRFDAPDLAQGRDAVETFASLRKAKDRF